ncbi:penicillin acylase family protein [Plastoroseomonas arctica]|uniref:Penicillin acylase family protein n=1 Tax=Plastoroseomonas arctica TaxID=1509237 RepID=A0AAF1K412_9PROT|nr:penicillin acylase family protein [Plastoroseomonas arctica]MBR0655851.1 penicillin acylase family protein [Plastoroseomonas arctica]
MAFLFRFLGRCVLALALLIPVAVSAAVGLVWWTLPPEHAEVRIPTLDAPVAVTLDTYGIPLIRASTEADGNRALGWMHARDRLFQMEMMRRGATGRLSEIAGTATLRLDRFTRLLGLAQRAEADFATLPEPTRAALTQYAEGVNAWITAHGRFAAPEFLILGAPEPWRPADSLLWAKVMGLWLSGNWREEMNRMRLVGRLPPERIAELWPRDTTQGRPDEAEQRAALPGLDRLAAQIPVFGIDAPLPASASNAWAVTAARAAGGAPMLASDPHLAFSAPILWYLARIELPEGRFLAGATAPGTPFVVIGRNRDLAWGFTTTQSDTQDLVYERAAGTGYATPQGPRAFTTRTETIAIRGAPSETLTVRETRHGPVLTDLDPAPRADGLMIAMAMANLAPNDTAAAGLLALNRGTTLADARAAAALITSPPQNMMVAARSGEIAMYLTGRTPLRRSGDGTRPFEGWNPGQGWSGFVPFDAMPHVENPTSGLLANANNRPSPPDHPVFLAASFPGSWRFQRAMALLNARPQHSTADFAAMQVDTLSLFARAMLPALATMPRPEGAAGAALDLLLAWDGQASAALPQPLIFNAFMERFGRWVMRTAGLAEDVHAPSQEFLAAVLDGRLAHWCGAAGCGPLAATALGEAVRAISREQGPDPAAWRWGAAHAARFEHPMLRFIPALAALTRMEVPASGDGDTLLRAGFRGEDFTAIHGAGLRAVFDLSDPDGTLAVIASGQSGHPMSRHWRDLLPAWRDGLVLRLDGRGTGGGSVVLRPQ